MIRDPGPIHSLGFSVTSRDIPTNEGESEGDAPNSGYITRALNGHPIMRFFAVSAATMFGTVLASRLTRKGGLKLSKFIQDSADAGAGAGEANFATSIVKNVVDIRRHLDELQGVERIVGEGKDPYSKLIFEQEGRLTTGYEGPINERRGYGFRTAEDRIEAARSFMSESTSDWVFKDELQQRLIRSARRLPYELPAMYGVQKVVTDSLFGERDHSERKVKWYNPVDVVADFTKTSLTNLATMIMPFEFAGAAVSQSRSSLHTLRYSMNDMRRLSPTQKAIRTGVRDISELLSEVGHDFATLTNKFLKTSAQVSGSLSAATDIYRNQNDFLQNWSRLRKGWDAARESAFAAKESRIAFMKRDFKQIFSDTADPSVDKYTSVLDLVPSFSGLSKAIIKGRQEFKITGYAYDAMDNSIAYTRSLAKMKGMHLTEDDLIEAINKIQSKHSSRLSSFATGVRVLGGGGPGDDSFTRSQFYIGHQIDSFKDVLEQQLISRGVGKADAQKFVAHAKILGKVERSSNVTNILSIGRNKIIGNGTTDQELMDDIFGQLINRYKQVKGHEGITGRADAKDVLQRSIEAARDIVTSREFARNLKSKAGQNWNAFYRKDLLTAGEGILKAKKAQYQDFIQPNSYEQRDFLTRKVAQSLGIKLTGSDGFAVSDAQVYKALAARGFGTPNDPSYFLDLRAFLIKNRQMTSGVIGGGFNLFGLQSVGVAEGLERGRLSHLRPEERKIIGSLAGARTREDPVASALALSRLDGVYKTKTGEILDFTAVKSTFKGLANFFASEFKIPILGFNPVDLFGYQSFSEMAKKSPLQYISSRSVQPFLPKGETRADFHIWARSKGTKGRLIRFDTADDASTVYSSVLPGMYRTVPTASSDLLTRHSIYGANERGMTIPEVTGKSSSKVLNFLFGDNAVKVQRRLSLDSEQPNSLFAAMGRFARRKKDIDNFSVIAAELRDKSKEEIQEVLKSERGTDFLRSFAAIGKSSLGLGVPTRVMRELERLFPEEFTILGMGASQITSAKSAVEVFGRLEKALPELKKNLEDAGVDSNLLEKAFSRMRMLIEEGNLAATSQLARRSPTITTRLEQFQQEYFRFSMQASTAISGRGGNEAFIKLINQLDEMVSSGAISSAQRTEAQAAAFGTLYNFSAFRTFTDSNVSTGNDKAKLLAFMDSKVGLEKIFTPYTEGSISQISSSVRKRFSPLLAPTKKYLGSAPYSPSDDLVNPLGSGQSVTLVPTFGTVFGKDPFGAIRSALGVDTYRNPETFSTGSIPVSQGVERLNKYFGSLGMQLDVGDFSGPLSLFAKGMVGKRVLPLYAAGTVAMTADRMAGGLAYGEDQSGERIYAPLVLGQIAKAGVEAQAAMAGLYPGGMTYEEKKEQLVEGEVPIRQGRFWPLGNTPFKGGKIMYYRPSWYRKLQGGAMFTEDTYGSPLEKMLFYNDISPLRPFDPYRFEREHYYDRPYPVTGEYFSGPFGPLVPIANATIGKVLKPPIRMHQEELEAELTRFAPAGQFGAYYTGAYDVVMAGQIQSMGAQPALMGFQPGSSAGTVAMASSGVSGGGSGSQFIADRNAQLAGAAGPMFTARNMVAGDIGVVNAGYAGAAFGPPKVRGVMSPRIVPSGEPLSAGSGQFQLGEIGYRTQEMLGIYGFGFGALRQSLGFGQGDFEPQRSVLQSATKAYSSTRAFWDLNLGGLGDVPLPTQDGIGNIEFSEIIRRFIPKERTNIDYINPIRNTMGMQYPWLPGSEYYTDFTRGDPYTKVQEGELRLPGIGYERFNTLYSDETGRYGVVNQLDILADVAPYSDQFKKAKAAALKADLSPDEKIKVGQILEQVENTTTRKEFSEYKYLRSSPEEAGLHPFVHNAARLGEFIAHSDNFVISKIAGKRTAIEDWERSSVYGTTFPEWQRPFESYIQPMIYKATQGNPITEAASLGFVGGMFGRTPRAKLLGSAVGVATGAAASVYGNLSEFFTGDRFIPQERKKELALEEYSDILNYVKNARLANQAKAAGDSRAAAEFASAAGRTMYGMDLSRLEGPGVRAEQISLALPKRKREHFVAMLNAPEEDRERILSTAPRLERRLYQAAWGMRVEKRPDLVEYFSRHELPNEDWEGWLPGTSMDSIKIKMGQSLGLEMSQMGYYPQQIKEANLLNPSYPQFGLGQDRQDVTNRLKILMNSLGINGSVSSFSNPFGSNNFNVNAGVG